MSSAFRVDLHKSLPDSSRRDMDTQGEAGAAGLLVPSPQSEAVTHELGELSLQPNQNLPPLKERKNGESTLQAMHGTVE